MVAVISMSFIAQSERIYGIYVNTAQCANYSDCFDCARALVPIYHLVTRELKAVQCNHTLLYINVVM